VNKMQKLMAGIEELERMRGHVVGFIDAGRAAVSETEPGPGFSALAPSTRTSASSDAQLVEAINAQPDTHSLTPHA
jgi:hypothetical protein